MSIWEAILAAMLMLQAPGRSIYSQVVVEADAPAPCDDQYSLLCRPPRWSDAHQAYTVAETWEQGLVRYATIAKQIDVAIRYGKGGKGEWVAPTDWLWRYAVVTAYNESGFRRDVHSGVGSAARGDCDWTGPRGKRTRIPGSCKSHGLFQRLLGRGTTREGWSGDDITGLDDLSTWRAVYDAVRNLDRSYAYCSTRGPRPLHGCVFATYGGVNTVKDHRIQKRIRAFHKSLAAPTTLTAEVREALGLPEAVAKGSGGVVHSSP